METIRPKRQKVSTLHGLLKLVITFEEETFMEQAISEVLLLEKTEGVNIDHLREMLYKMAEEDKK